MHTKHYSRKLAAVTAKWGRNVNAEYQRAERPEWMSPASKCKAKADAGDYTARKAGRDNAPKWDASSTPDSLKYQPLLLEKKLGETKR